MAVSGGDGSIILNTKVDNKGLNSGLNSMKDAITKIGGLLAAAFSVNMLINFAKESKKLYKIQMENEVKLATVMRQRMNATDDEIKSVLELASAYQQIGIIGDEVQLAGLQQLATFATQKETIETLLPAMNNLIAQQYGYEASAESARNVANLMGKVLQGQTGALTRTGITFSETEEQMLKTGNEMERAAVLAQVITNNVGEMNSALAQTDVGRQQQLANTWGDIKEQFGAAFQQIAIIALPVLNAVAKALAWVANVARMVAQTIANMFGMKKSGGDGNQSTGLGGISTSSNEAAEGMSNLGDATEKAGKQAKKSLAPFDDLHIITSDIADNTSIASNAMNDLGVSGGISGIGTGFDFGIQADVGTITPLQKAIEDLRGAFSGIKDIDLTNLSNSLKSLKEPLQGLAELAWDTLLWGIENVVTPITSIVVETVLPGFFELLGEALTILKDVLDEGLNLFKDFYDTFVLPIVSAVVTYAVPVFFEVLSGALKILKGILDEGLDLFKDFYENFIKPVGSHIGEKFVEFWGELTPKMEEFSNLFKNSSLWDDIVSIWQKLKDSFSVLFQILTPIVNGLVDVAFEIAKPLVLTHYIDAEEKFKNLEDVVGAVASLLEGDFKGAWEHTKDFLVTNHIDTAKEKVQLVKDTFSDLKDKIEETMSKWEEAWENISVWYEEYVEPWFEVEKWVELFGNILIAVNRFFGDEDGMYQTWKESMGIWWDEHVSPWFTQEKWDSTFSVVHTSLEDMMYKSGGFFATWDYVINDWWNNKVLPMFSKERWTGIWKNVKDTFSEVWNDQDGIVYEWRTKITDWWDNDVKPFFAEYEWKNLGKDLVTGLWEGIASLPGLLVNLVNGCLDAFQGLANGVIDLVNSFIDGYNSVADGVLLKKKKRINDIDLTKYHISLPTLAQGAVIPPNREFLAVLGDQKHGTNIEAPLQTIVDAFNVALAQNGSTSGGNTEVVLEIDGREFGRAVVEQGNRENRRIGTRLVIA